MSEEEFDNWVCDVHSELFHVMPTDLDENGVRIDQTIVIKRINENPKVLLHKTLRELLDMFEVL